MNKLNMPYLEKMTVDCGSNVNDHSMMSFSIRSAWKTGF